MPEALRNTLLTTPSTRRQLLSQGARACLTFGLSQTLWTRELFANPKSADFERWLADLLATGERLKKGEITTEQWQSAMDVLYGSVSLNDLRAHIDFGKMSEDFDFSVAGEKLVDLDPLSGEPFSDPQPGRDRVMTKLGGVRRGKNVPPHGHENMTSAFLVLHGEFHLRQYDKLRTNVESLVFRKSRDEAQKPGDWSSVSDTVRNMHWLHANSGDAFFFSTKLIYIVPDAPMKGRIYVDLRQPRDLGGGNIEALIIGHNRAQEIYNDT
jgi:hypothetical protein